ncbi:MAG: hypothetical protein AB7S78_13575 [Candidatus Omnitrophota bacterium]
MKITKVEFKHTFIFLLSTFLLTGCGTFNGNIKIQNASSRDIVVRKLEGFKYEPPCGILTAGASAGSFMYRMPFPEEVRIHWWYSEDLNTWWDSKGQVHVDTIDLNGLRPPQLDAELLLEFTPDERWVAKIYRFPY